MSDWQGWIGRTTVATAVIDAAQANHMAVVLDREPAWRDGDALPPAWHWLYFHDLVRSSDLGEDGHPRLGITMPPVPLPRRMWAGGTLAFGASIRLGATVTRTSTIRSITPKEGRSGALWFVNVEHDLATDGERNVLETQTIVYREQAAETPGAAAPAPLDADASARWHLDSPALFRYSALTFNSHRIHYDVEYARSAERYPDVVVHGPLIATLLLDLAVREGRPIGRFTYRAKSPLFLPDAFTVNLAAEGGLTRLWAASHDGGLAMEAEAGPA